MGGGSWTKASYKTYADTRGVSLSFDGSLNVDKSYSAQEMFKQREIAEELDPKNVIRECCDSEEHPNTFPVILALDVTGSMGSTAVEVAKKLNVIMTTLYDKVDDIQFMTMGIGDMVYDYAPVQASQFESDIRIAEQLDKVWFEGHGGGNAYESYTAAWLFGTRHVKLDCWNRGKKGIIITMGDELINPYLPKNGVKRFLGDDVQGDVETSDLYKEVSEKYDVYHLVVEHSVYSSSIAENNAKSFERYLGADNVKRVTLENISDAIVEIVMNSYKERTGTIESTTEEGVVGFGTISW